MIRAEASCGKEGSLNFSGFLFMVDGWLIIGCLLIFNGFCWKWWFWCIPSSVFGVVQPCRFLFLHKNMTIIEKHDFQVFSNDFVRKSRQKKSRQPSLFLSLQIYRLPPLPPTSKIRWFVFLFRLKWGFWCIPSSVFGLVQPCRVFFFAEKQHCLEKTYFFYDFSLVFHENGPNLLLNRGTTIKTGILTPVEFWWVP